MRVNHSFFVSLFERECVCEKKIGEESQEEEGSSCYRPRQDHPSLLCGARALAWGMELRRCVFRQYSKELFAHEAMLPLF